MAARDNHPGRAGGEHASSKNSKDAGARKGGKGGGGKGAGAFSDAGYANRENTGYRAGNGTGGFGGTKKAGNETVAQHMINIGDIRTPSIPAGGVAQGNYPSQDDAGTDYARAVGDYATRGFFGKAADALFGGFYDENEPMAGNPRSFAAGTYHTSTNPGSVFGLGVGALTGLPLAPLGGYLYDQSGLPQVWHGGNEQPDMRTGPFGNVGNGYDLGRSFSDLPDIKAPQTAGNPADIGRPVTPDPVARSRSMLNSRISTYSGGGYNMGAFGKKPSKKSNYLTQQLMAP